MSNLVVLGFDGIHTADEVLNKLRPLQKVPDWPLFSVAAVLTLLLAAGVFVVATLPPRTIVMAIGPAVTTF
jgi:hypothetical protein